MIEFSASAIKEALQEVVEQLGFEWVGLQVKAGNEGLLRLFIDHPDGVNLDHCEQVARAIDPLLEEMFPGEDDRYYLEVSSPGVERPLFTVEHYRRFIGHPLKAKLINPIASGKSLRGDIKDVCGDTIIITDLDGHDQEVSFDNIDSAHLEFKIQKGQKKTFKKGGGR